MNLRLDSLYDAIAEIEEHLEDARLRKEAAETEAIALENIYKILMRFGELYDIINDEEKKDVGFVSDKRDTNLSDRRRRLPFEIHKIEFPDISKWARSRGNYFG